LNPDTSALRLLSTKHRALTSLSNADFRFYLITATAAPFVIYAAILVTSYVRRRQGM
jgi:hypothetical protein